MILLPTLILGAALLQGTGLPDDPLSVGDPAPALSIEHFVKGERLDGFPADKVTVVEFWATWCAPCIEGFPHLSELQERYPEDVVIVSVSSEGLDTVESFLARPEHASVTRYRVACDPDGSMQADWMTAAGQAGIPCAFLVDRGGIVRYIGHPMAMDRVLEQVVTGREPVEDEARMPAVSDAERAALTTVPGTHSPEAQTWIDELVAQLSAPDGVLDFEQELVLRDALRVGDADVETHDLRKTREGVLCIGESRASGPPVRVDATRTMHLPGLPGEGMTERETVLYLGDDILLKYASESPFMPSPLPTDGWTVISRADARAFSDELPIPLAMTAMMEVNPVVANPLDMLHTLLGMSALEVERAPGRRDDGAAVVLSGPAAPLAGIPALLESTGPLGEEALDLPTLRLEFVPGSGQLDARVGPPGAPSLSMRIHRRTRTGPAAPEVYALDEGEAAPVALLPLLRERMRMMSEMRPAPSR